MTTIPTERPLPAPLEKPRPRWWLKACPKCHGDLYEERAWGETNVVCLLCGRALTREEEEKLGVFGNDGAIWGLDIPTVKPAAKNAA